jgi:hypothetical protein
MGVHDCKHPCWHRALILFGPVPGFVQYAPMLFL